MIHLALSILSFFFLCFCGFCVVLGIAAILHALRHLIAAVLAIFLVLLLVKSIFVAFERTEPQDYYYVSQTKKASHK